MLIRFARNAVELVVAHPGVAVFAWTVLVASVIVVNLATAMAGTNV